MLIQQPTGCKKQSSLFYFTKNFCKKFGITFLYILQWIIHETFNTKATYYGSISTLCHKG